MEKEIRSAMAAPQISNDVGQHQSDREHEQRMEIEVAKKQVADKKQAEVASGLSR